MLHLRSVRVQFRPELQVAAAHSHLWVVYRTVPQALAAKAVPARGRPQLRRKHQKRSKNAVKNNLNRCRGCWRRAAGGGRQTAGPCGAGPMGPRHRSPPTAAVGECYRLARPRASRSHGAMQTFNPININYRLFSCFMAGLSGHASAGGRPNHSARSVLHGCLLGLPSASPTPARRPRSKV